MISRVRSRRRCVGRTIARRLHAVQQIMMHPNWTRRVISCVMGRRPTPEPTDSMWKRYAALPRPVHLLCLGTLVNRAGTLVVVFLSIYIESELKLGVGLAAWTFGAYGCGALIASVVGGHLADGIGRRTVMLIALLGGAGVLIIFSSLRSPAAIVIAAFGFSLVADMYRPAASAMIADLVEPRDRVHAFGLMYYAINLGQSIAPVIGGYVASRSFQWLFWGDAFTTSLYAAIIFFTIRETLPGRTGRAESGPVAPNVPLRQALKHILRDRPFMVYVLASFLTAMVYMQCLSTFPMYLNMKGIGVGTYGKLIAINPIMIVVLQLPITAAITRFHRGTVIVVGTAIIAVGFGATGLVDTTSMFALTIMIWTLGELFQAPLMQAIVSDMAPVDMRGRYMGMFSMSFSSAIMIGAPLGGLVLQRWGGPYVWAGCLATGLLAAIIYNSIRKEMAVGTAAGTTG